jgi:hypothetical protein
MENTFNTEKESICLKTIISERELKGNEKSKKNYGSREKFIAGCQALSGLSVEDIVAKSGMSRPYVYQQKKKVKAYAESLDDEKADEGPVVVLNTALTKRLILCMALHCGSPIDGIERTLESALGIRVSTGYISGVIKEAAQRAQTFDDGISLAGIRQGANDEIFQGNTPILTGIDPESGYTYLLEEAADRSSETWEIYMKNGRSHGLTLETTINDGGTGLNAGIPKAFPGITIQADTFHAVYGMGKEVCKAERKAEAGIKAEADLEKRVQSTRAQEKTKEKLEQIRPETEELIRVYDILSILFTWLKELLGFSGCSLPETEELIRFVLEEMKKESAKFPGINKEAEKIMKILPCLLTYITRVEKAFEESAQLQSIPVEAFRSMYRQLAYGELSTKYWEIEYGLWDMLKEKYRMARGLFREQLKSVKKASSLVENLNGRIRRYMDVKREVPTGFFVLMKVYFNTRRCKRSRCPERIGKSPLELLTGKLQPEFLEALGY